MSKARELAELGAVYDSGALSNRNKIINGAFQVWQRGTSQTGTNSYSSVDRWVLYTSGNGLTASQSTDVPSASGLQYSITTTGTPSGEYILAQGIELPATGSAGEFYNGQKITISYYAKSSVAGDKLRHFIAFRNTVTGSTDQSIIENNTDQNDLTTSFQKFSKTYTISVNPNSNNTNLCVMIRTRNAANNSSTAAGNITITGVQLEVGPEATPFEHRSYGDELARCQRYYQKIMIPQRKIGGAVPSVCRWELQTEGEMRSNPTCTLNATLLSTYSPSGDQLSVWGIGAISTWPPTFSYLNSYGKSQIQLGLGTTSSNFTNGGLFELGSSQQDNGAFIAADAEL